ncbi:MAG: hypothetical protein HFE73_07335 [Firmicutes bacterium]|jgi:hypothetical protein|nr:hypothetical protein [Bacillota bacterium]
MSGIPKNFDKIGVMLVFLLASSRSGKLPALGHAIDFNLFTRDLHRMVDMIDRIDGLGQLTSSKSSLPSTFGSAASAPDSASNFNLPDMSQLMDMAGPLLSMFGNNNR